MIFADKLISLRKKAGWSQEELADQMGVTRQSVSKWEGAQSVPDLEKIIRLSQLFGVSTDYLLKDELEDADPRPSQDTPAHRRVSMEEANTFLAVKAKTAKATARAVFLCILSPVTLFVLSAVSENAPEALDEAAANAIGLAVLVILAAIAAALFISAGSRTAPFAYLEKENFETEYGVTGMVKDRQARYKATHTKNTVAGVLLCIASLLPLFAGAALESDLLLTLLLALTFLIAAIGVACLVRTGIIWSSFEKLLQEGEYSKENKKNPPVIAAVYTAYWVTAAALYLAYSLTTHNWGQSWILWPVSGTLFPAVAAITKCIVHKKR